MSKLIFFVDDDKMIINLLEYTFQSREQYEVKTFETGKACLDALDMNPDLVVLDHNLSGSSENMDGIQTLEQIREKKAALPVVVLTAFGTDELLNQYLNKGASRFLTKDDFFIDTLIETIGEILT